MINRIIGGDVCKASLVCWELAAVPCDLKKHFRDNKRKDTEASPDPLRFSLNSGGVGEFVRFLLGEHPMCETKQKADALALEPTGVHYSWLFARIAESHGVSVKWVGHQEAVFLRRQERLPDKNDQADSLALAVYCFKHWEQSSFFLDFSPFPITRIRELYLQLKFLNRVQSPLVNRGKQQLTREFPEAAATKFKTQSDGFSPLWSWIAGWERKGIKKSGYWPNRYAMSIAPEYGVEISDFSRQIGQFICQVNGWEKFLIKELTELLAYPELETYMRIFEHYGMGIRLKAILISQIFPINRFESLGSFKRRLGFGKVEQSSGDVVGFRKGGGSQMTKTELCLWIYTTYGNPAHRPATKRGEEIANFYDQRMEKFATNPEPLKIRAIEQMFSGQEKLLQQMENQTKKNPDSMMELQLTLMRKNIESTKETMIQAIKQGVNLKVDLGDKSNSSRGYGDLVTCQTAAFALRRLFKDLREAIL